MSTPVKCPTSQIFDLASHWSKVYSHKQFNKLYNACKEIMTKRAIRDIRYRPSSIVCHM